MNCAKSTVFESDQMARFCALLLNEKASFAPKLLLQFAPLSVVSAPKPCEHLVWRQFWLVSLMALSLLFEIDNQRRGSTSAISNDGKINE